MRLVTQRPIPLEGGVTTMANIHYHQGNFTAPATILLLPLHSLAILIHTLFGLQLYRTSGLTGPFFILGMAAAATTTETATATMVSALP
jgi:hypothetical protein